MDGGESSLTSSRTVVGAESQKSAGKVQASIDGSQRLLEENKVSASD